MGCCAVVAASEFNKDDFLEQHAAGAFDCVLAVDGGYAHLQQAGCKPTAVLGDFDSLGYVPQDECVEVHPTHKDQSDMELALEWATSNGHDRMRVYGALGGRLDHTLANLQICARYAELGAHITVIDETSAIRLLVGPGSFELPRFDRGTVSVFSAVDESKGVTEVGMEYPLENATLTNRTTLGVSNELQGEPAAVSLVSGTLFVLYPLAGL